MSVTQQNVNDLNAILKVKVNEQEYQPLVESALKQAQKSVSLKGFRPGKVPFGMVKKLYGTSVKVEQINKLIDKKISDYIISNKINVLGQPLPKINDEVYNFETQSEFEFEFEIGVAPEINVKLDKAIKLTKYNVVPDAEMIGNYIEELRSRYGKVEEVEDVQDKDMITANLTELNDDQSVKEGGINQTINFFMPRISNADAKAKLVGLKKGDKVVVNAKTLTDSITDSARTLGLTAEQLENASDNFEITIQSSSRMGLADLNQELFDKVFGEGNVKNEEEFNTKIQEDAVKFLKGHGANKFKNDLIDLLVDTVKFDLPNEFLQKWLVAASEGKTSQEEVQKDYDKYAKTFRWQLIEGAIVKDTKIDVSYEEIKNKAKELISENFTQYGQLVDDAQLETYAANVLKKQEEARRLQDEIFLDKVANYALENISVEEKEITIEEFTKLTQA
jgi:trigger factor